jgi:hypothetical protein
VTPVSIWKNTPPQIVEGGELEGTEMPQDLVASTKLTRAEQTDLLRVIRGRERVAKAAVAERAAALRTDFEAQISKRYRFDDNAIWSAAMEAAKRAADEARATIDAECERLGIPPEFRPGIERPHWYGRGENSVRERRAELRRLAYAQIEEAERRAKLQIERTSVQAQSEVIATGLSATAKVFLDSLPSVETLMPALELERVEQLRITSRPSYH